MGCCRSLDRDKLVQREKYAAFGEDPPLLPGRGRGGRDARGLMACRGYAIVRVCEAAAPPTPTHDGATFNMLQVTVLLTLTISRSRYGTVF